MKNTPNPSLILFRGLPGSGKTMLAKLLSEDGKYPVFSIDQYFTDVDGKYVFDHLKNHIAYKECEENVRRAMSEKCTKIFIDHTFTLDWEIEPYFKMALENNYLTFVCTVENYHGHSNVHGISDEQMKKMLEKYKVRLLP